MVIGNNGGWRRGVMGTGILFLMVMANGSKRADDGKERTGLDLHMIRSLTRRPFDGRVVVVLVSMAHGS